MSRGCGACFSLFGGRYGMDTELLNKINAAYCRLEIKQAEITRALCVPL